MFVDLCLFNTITKRTRMYRDTNKSRKQYASYVRSADKHINKLKQNKKNEFSSCIVAKPMNVPYIVCLYAFILAVHSSHFVRLPFLSSSIFLLLLLFELYKQRGIYKCVNAWCESEPWDKLFLIYNFLFLFNSYFRIIHSCVCVQTDLGKIVQCICNTRESLLLRLDSDEFSAERINNQNKQQQQRNH